MKRQLITFFTFLCTFILIAPATPLFAQSPSENQPTSASSLLILPTLFPSLSQPLPQNTTFPLLEKLDELATPATSSATSNATNSAAQAVPLPEYCLDVPVLMYHHVEPLSIAEQLGHPQLTVDSGIFEEQMRYLVEHQYHTISVDEMVYAIKEQKPLPDHSVVITLDDGYIDNYTYAFLYAKKYHIVMNFMIPTGLVGQPDYVSWDHLKEMAANPYAKIYNHTTTHAPLGLIDKDKIIEEVTTANKQLIDNLGITNDVLTYPYGSYSDLAIETIKQFNIVAALSTDAGRNECTSNLMKLPRVRVGNASLAEYGL
jgi:peptidoglycan/xylan/chitin deacetylase (PgdA/CDA1 family)